MKNVIVFARGAGRYAIELRWVREVLQLHYVTPVPGAPTAIAGVVNVRGAAVPLLRVEALLDAADRMSTNQTVEPPERGDSALLIEVEGVSATIRVSSVEEVSTLEEMDGINRLCDSGGAPVPLLDPPSLFRRAMRETNSVRDSALGSDMPSD